MLSIYSQFMKSFGQFSDLLFFTHVAGQLYQVITCFIRNVRNICGFFWMMIIRYIYAFDYVKCSKNYQEWVKIITQSKNMVSSEINEGINWIFSITSNALINYISHPSRTFRLWKSQLMYRPDMNKNSHHINELIILKKWLIK